MSARLDVVRRREEHLFAEPPRSAGITASSADAWTFEISPTESRRALVY